MRRRWELLSHIAMRSALLGTLGLLALTTVVGCGPGLTRHSKAAKAPDVFATMDAELANAVATTTVTSGEPMPLPESRLSLAQWEEEQAEPAPPPVQTWGAPVAFPPELASSPYVVEAKPAADPASYP